MKTIVAISDMHCGHFMGLTPPKWQANAKSEIGIAQRKYWSTFYDSVPKSPDALLVVGDSIDGKGERSGGTEQLSGDRLEQCEIAVEAIACIKPKKIVMVYGTPYHVGREEDFEGIVAERLRARGFEVSISAHETVEVEGIVFDVKHKVGSSQIPHGRHTAVSRERLWNLLWSYRGQRKKADIILRGHVHYYSYCGDGDFHAMSLPSLQGLGGKYGGRECSGTVDFGFVVFRTRRDEAGRGAARPGAARRGVARQGKARQGKGCYLQDRKNFDAIPYLFDMSNDAAGVVVV